MLMNTVDEVAAVAERDGLLDLGIELQPVLDVLRREQRAVVQRPTSLARSMMRSGRAGR